MKIKKLGHCCLAIEVDGVRIMTDPGIFTVGTHENVNNIDAVVITHEHGDHFHVESLKEIVQNNPDVRVIANAAVGKLLDAASIAHEVVDGTASTMAKNVSIEAFDAKHEEIFEEIGQVQNTGYWIAGKLFHPGDAFADPGKPVDVLAFPIAGPPFRLADAMRYVLKIKPRTSIPVHDGMLKPGVMKFGFTVMEDIFPKRGSSFTPMVDGDEKEF